MVVILIQPKAVSPKHVAPSNSLHLPRQNLDRIKIKTPVAFTKVRNGWLGYIRDVNDEVGSQMVAREMGRFAAYIAGAE